MKKMNFRAVLAGVLALVLMLSCFAGCTKEDNNGAAAATAEDAIAYLKAIYKDDGAQTAVDFERFSLVRIGGVPFEVVWTANVDETLVKVTANDNGTATIDVNEECSEETKYVLTASVKNDKGEALTHSWNYVLPKGKTSKVPVCVKYEYDRSMRAKEALDIKAAEMAEKAAEQEKNPVGA